MEVTRCAGLAAAFGLASAAALLGGPPALARQSAAASDALYYAASEITSVGTQDSGQNVTFIPSGNCNFSIQKITPTYEGAGNLVYRYRGSFSNAYLLRSTAGGASFILIAPRGGPVVTYSSFNDEDTFPDDTASVLPVRFISEAAGVTAMNAFNRVSAECGLPPVTQ